MSIRTTSGAARLASSIASSPSSASPTTSRSCLQLEDRAEARPHEGLVVATRTRTHGRSGREAGTHSEPAAGWPDRPRASPPYSRTRSAHPDDPVARRSARSPVRDRRRPPPARPSSVLVADLHPRAGRACVLERVRERFLDDSVRREVDARRAAACGLALDRRARPSGRRRASARPARASARQSGLRPEHALASRHDAACQAVGAARPAPRDRSLSIETSASRARSGSRLEHALRRRPPAPP